MTLETVPISDKLSFSEEEYYDNWILLATPIPVLTVIGCYLLFVLKIGPKFMEKREPYNLNGIMMVYNIYQVIYNAVLVLWLFINPSALSYLKNHSCHPLDPKENPLRYELALAAWAYLFSKIIDLLDTSFMVLRKKFSHLTFLHLYHHTAMVLCSWYCIKYIRAEQGVIPGTINAFVHVVMYAYYFLAAFGPGIQKYLWWKRYITRLQMTQFVVVIAFWAYLFINDCEVSQAYNVMWMTNVFVILVLFTNFYIQTYIIKPSKAKKAVKKEE